MRRLLTVPPCFAFEGTTVRAILGLTMGVALGAAVAAGPARAQQAVASTDSARARVPTQRAVARMLLSRDSARRADGLRMALMVRPEHASRELRFGLVGALHAQGTAFREILRRPEHDGPADGRARPVSREHDQLLRAVIALDDSVTIPALAHSLGTGMLAIRSLVGFGPSATSAVVQVARATDGGPEPVVDALVTLRMIVEDASARPLSPAKRGQVRGVAVERLGGRQTLDVLLRAIDLAIVLGEQDLRQVVTALAADPRAPRQRGIENAADISRVQQHARDRLAGVPPQPPR